MFCSVAGPNLKAMLLNVNTPETRGSVFCSMYLADCIGKGIGPYIVGRMISHFGSRYVGWGRWEHTQAGTCYGGSIAASVQICGPTFMSLL